MRLALCTVRQLYSAYICLGVCDRGRVNATTQHKVVWGGLRFFLGLAQMWLALVGLVLLVSIGLRPVTYLFVGAATAATVTSRLLYRGRPGHDLKGGKK